MYLSQCLTVHFINLLLTLRLLSVLLELQLQNFPATNQTFAILMLQFDLFLQSLKLSRSLYSPYSPCVSSSPVTTLSILSQKNSDRAASVPPSFFPSSIVAVSVNSLNLSYVEELNPYLLKQQNLCFRNLCRLLKPQPALTLLLTKQFLMVQFLIQQIPHSFVLHL